LGYTMYTANFP